MVIHRRIVNRNPDLGNVKGMELGSDPVVLKYLIALGQGADYSDGRPSVITTPSAPTDLRRMLAGAGSDDDTKLAGPNG